MPSPRVHLGQRIIRRTSVNDALSRGVPYSPREKLDFDASKLRINSIENAHYRRARNRSKKDKKSNKLSKQVLMSIKESCNELQNLDQSFKDVLLKIFQEHKELDYKIDFKDFDDIIRLLTEYNEQEGNTACMIFRKYITDAQLDNFKKNLERQKEFTSLITNLHDFKRQAEGENNERRSNDFNIPFGSISSDSAFGKIRKNKSVKKKKGKGKNPSLRNKKKTKGN